MPEAHYKGEVKFLINNNRLLVNDLPSSQAPSHVGIAFLGGLVSKSVAKQIISAEDEARPALMDTLISQSVLGGYCIMISDDPPTYEYTFDSGTVPPASEDQFNKVQKSGKIEFLHFQDSDLPITKLL